jgi:site-specific DNA-methyltransferase (adenine-specific)
VDKKMTIIVGHTRYEASKKLELKKVPITIADLTPLQAKAYRIADNRVNQDSEWDFPLLNIEFTDLLDNHFELDNLGFDNKELENLITNNSTGLTDEDEVPEKPKKAKTKLGDIYQLGNHRLLCGDAVNKKSLIKLINKNKIHLAFVDPPYNVNYNYNQHSDNLKEDEYKDFCNNFLNLLLDICNNVVVTSGWGNAHIYPKPKHTGIWIKRNGMTHSYISQFSAYEPILFFGDKWKRERNIDLFEHNLKITKELMDLGHTCPKPLDLIFDIIKNYSSTNNNVIDTFLGSGTTLIACEKLNRKCYGMELDPIYCDVIIKRWEDYTGQKAKKI